MLRNCYPQFKGMSFYEENKKILKALKIVFRIWMKWEYRRGRKGVVFFQSKHSFALVNRAHSICFQYLFFKPSFLIGWNERKEKKTCAGNSANRMQVKNQSDNDHVMYLSSVFVAKIYGRSRKSNEQSFIFMKNYISASIKCNCAEKFFIWLRW